MHAIRGAGTAGRPHPATAPDARRPTAGPSPDGEQPFGPDAASIPASEHWSLLGFRSLIWNEAMSRATVFLSVLSAAIITLALLANAAGGSHTTALALVLLPVVLFLGVATHIRVVQINTEEIEVMLAMNRLRHACLQIEPGLEPYFTSGHHDDALVWAALVSRERHTLDPVARTTPRFPTPPDHS